MATSCPVLITVKIAAPSNNGNHPPCRDLLSVREKNARSMTGIPGHLTAGIPQDAGSRGT